MESFTLIEIFGNGKTQPQIEDDTEVLLIQDGMVSVGMLTYDDDDTSIFIDSPINELVLNKEALELIQNKFPHYLQTKTSIVLACPEIFAGKMQW